MFLILRHGQCFAAQDPEMRPKITLQQEAEPVDSIEHYTRLLEPSLWWELVGKLGVADGTRVERPVPNRFARG